MRHKVALVARLTPADWFVLLRAAFWLLCADLGLRLFGLPRTQALLRCGLPGLGSRTTSALGDDDVTHLSYLVSVAARHHLYPMACLPRSLVLQRLLAQAGIETELRIGVRRDPGGLRAHAWVERQGRPLGEACDPRLLFAALDGSSSAGG